MLKVREEKARDLLWIGRNRNKNGDGRTHKNGCNKIANPAINTSDTVSLRSRRASRPLFTPFSIRILRVFPLDKSIVLFAGKYATFGMGRSCTQIAGNTGIKGSDGNSWETR